MQFHVEITGGDPLGLKKLCEDYVDKLWFPKHYSPEQAAYFALDQFKRAVSSRLNALAVLPHLNDATEDS